MASKKGTGSKKKAKTKTEKLLDIDFNDTSEISVPPRLIDQVIGQETASEIIKKAALQRRHVLLIGEPGTGKCVSSTTQITLDDGTLHTAESLFNRVLEEGQITYQDKNKIIIVPTKEDYVSFSISSEDLKVSKDRITHVGRYKAPSKLRKIKTRYGSEVVLTDNHPVLTIDENQGLLWKPIGRFIKGDKIACVRSLNLTENNEINLSNCTGRIVGDLISYKTHKNDSCSRSILLPKKFDTRLAKFLAYMFSETSITRNRNIIFTNKFEEVVRDFAHLADELFDVKFNVAKRISSDIFYAQASSSSLCRFMNEVFGLSLSIPERSRNNRFPQQLINTEKEVISQFLKTYFDMEGHISKPERKCIELTSSSNDIIESIRISLLRFGIISKIKSVYKSAINSKDPKTKEYYTLYIQGRDNLEKFRDSISFDFDYKLKRLEESVKSHSNPNIDIVPGISNDFKYLKEQLGFKNKDVTKHSVTYSRYKLGERNPSRESLKEITEQIAELYLETQETKEDVENRIIKLSSLSISDIFWDEIVENEQSKGHKYVYDFTIENNHNFLSTNILLHNSMLGQAMAELLPKEELVDVLCIANPKYPNQPRVATLPAGHGARKVEMDAEVARKSGNKRFIISIAILLAIIGYALIATAGRPDQQPTTLLMAMFVGFFIFFMLNQSRSRTESLVPKLLVDNNKKDKAPFYDATGSHAGALLGDVRHDPFQSGGLGTPPHERVESGLIHKSHLGVLYCDEIGTLEMRTQQKLLTAMQEGKLQITGQSELSSGAMVRSEPVPCRFVLIAAGNIETTRNMHPALRSRIQGSGYEVYMQDTMKDLPENRRKLARFCAQEIFNDRKIPHFTKEGVEEIIYEAQRRADKKGHLTLRLRELGGLIRAAGDLAKERGEELVSAETVRLSKVIARTLENQMSDAYAESRKLYKIFKTENAMVGRVNGLAVINQRSGIVMPIEAEVVPAFSRREGKIIATGQLRVIAREAVQNVSALVKKYVGKDISDFDYHIQFVGAYAGVEGDSASISIAVAIISALEKAPIRQDTAMTGSLTVRGIVIPIGGATAKIEAASAAGIKRVIIPVQNIDDVKLEERYKDKVEIIPVSNFHEVLRAALPDEYHSIADKFEVLANEKSEIPNNKSK